MNKGILLAALASTALALAGCHHGWKSHHHADTAKIADNLKSEEAQWNKDYAAKNVDMIAAHYADDAVLGAPGAPLATSDADRRKSIAQLTNDPNFKLSFAPDKVEAAKSGDFAYTRGHYSITTTDKATNKPVTSEGGYLTVYQQQSDGSWKVIEDFITPGPAPAAAK